MPRRSIDRRSLTAPGGFTLIEMLVATTLVVLMMLLFAQIYAAAIRTLNVQQALARNDQRARSVDQVLRSDLLRGSFRQIPGSRGIVPLVNGDVVHTTQKGYFYLSENDQSNPLDDVLQFTMLVSPDCREHDQTPFYGRCVGVPPGPDSEDAYISYPNSLVNHPDADDGIPENDVGLSRGAEVSYFVRGGNLYRRVLLLRDPQLGIVQYGNQPVDDLGNFPIDFNLDGTLDVFNELAKTNNPADMPTNADGNFYQRYDYAAYGDAPPPDGTAALVRGAGLRFLGVSSLDNYGTEGSPSVSLGMSQYRFGFHQGGLLGTGTGFGQPIEYANGVFFGRMTHAETSSPFCVWPSSSNYYVNGSLVAQHVNYPNPITSPGASLVYNTATNQLTADGNLLYGTTRINEDLLLNNVESFDVEVWDPNLDAFVQLGAGTGAAAFNESARATYPPTALPPYVPEAPSYGPNRATPDDNWVFDTGHPAMWSDDPSALSPDVPRPAYRPLMYRFSEDTNGNMALDIPLGEDRNGNGHLDRPTLPTLPVFEWQTSFSYSAGAVVIPVDDPMTPDDSTQSIVYRCIRTTNDPNGNGILDTFDEDSNGNGVLNPGEDANNNGRLDSPETGPLAGNSGITEPAWPLVAGVQFDDGSVTWESFDNRIGLEMIRITIRTRDTTTGNPRQFSIIHSFVEPLPAE